MQPARWFSLAIDDLRDQREHPGRPAEDQRVVPLDHEAAAPAELLDLGFDRGDDEADQRAADEDAEQRDQQHRDPQRPAAVARERPGVEDAQEALPEPLEQRRVLVLVDPTPKIVRTRAATNTRRDRDHGQPQDDEPVPCDIAVSKRYRSRAPRPIRRGCACVIVQPASGRGG